MCSTDAFNMFIIKSDGSIWVHTNIIDPRYIVYDDDGIASYSNIFIMRFMKMVKQKEYNKVL